MNEKDKQIVGDTLISVADSLVSSVPLLNVAWGLSKAYYGAGLKLRRKKALEWVEMIKDNRDIFIDELLSNEKFQDGFVYALEFYLRERGEGKRKIMTEIFKGFSMNIDQEFELERLYSVLNLLSLDDISVIREIDYNATDYYQIYGNTDKNIDNIHNLMNAGILIGDFAGRLGYLYAPNVKITYFGKKFVEYIS